MRLIDADILMEECYKELEDNSLWYDEDTSKDYADGHDEGKRIMIAIIDQASSIDIVRCKECKYEPICIHSVQHTMHEPTSVAIAYRPIDFCSYGERKDKCKECWYWSEVHKRCENKCGCQFKPYGERGES